MSYTEAHPAKSTWRCATCSVALSGDDVSEETVAMFHAAHAGHEMEVTVR